MKKLFSLIISAALFTTFILPGYSHAQTVQKSAEYSKEEIFKGIFFAQGKVAEELDHVFSDNVREAAKQSKVKKVANELVHQIKEKDSSYLNELKDAVDSQNPLAIQKALNDGSELILDLSDKLLADTKVKVISKEGSKVAGGATGDCVVLGLALVYYAAVVAQLAAGVLYVAGAAVYLKTAAVSNSIDEPATKLSNEILVKEIASNL